MYFVYVLKSGKDGNHYVGQTNSIEKRLAEHNAGKVKSTKQRRPFELVYFEACIDRRDAWQREIYLKTAWGKRYIKNRIKNYLSR